MFRKTLVAAGNQVVKQAPKQAPALNRINFPWKVNVNTGNVTVAEHHEIVAKQYPIPAVLLFVSTALIYYEQRQQLYNGDLAPFLQGFNATMLLPYFDFWKSHSLYEPEWKSSLYNAVFTMQYRKPEQSLAQMIDEITYLNSVNQMTNEDAEANHQKALKIVARMKADADQLEQQQL